MNIESFTFLCRTKTCFGKNALDHLPYELSGMGAQKPFVLQDQQAESSNCVKPLSRAFMESGMTLGIWPSINRDIEPGMDMLKDCYQTFINKGFDSIIVLGTGKITHLAKALNLAVSFGPGVIKNGIDQKDKAKSLLPFAFLPTGTGTGLETHCAAKINSRVFELPNLGPDIALIDEKIMGHENLDNLINSALTALSVCCETLALSRNPMAKAYADTGINLIMAHLFPLVEQEPYWDSTLIPDSKPDRHHMACLAHASAITGFLLANNKSLISCNLGYFIAEECSALNIKASSGPIMAGAIMAILLPRVLEIFSENKPGSKPENKPDLSHLLLSLCGQDEFSAIPSAQQANAAIHKLNKVLNKLYQISYGTIPRSLEDAGMDKSLTESIAEKIFQQEISAETGIPGIDKDKIKTVLTRSLTGQL